MSDPLETQALRTLGALRAIARSARRPLEPGERPGAVLADLAAHIDGAADDLELTLTVLATARPAPSIGRQN